MRAAILVTRESRRRPAGPLVGRRPAFRCPGTVTRFPVGGRGDRTHRLRPLRCPSRPRRHLEVAGGSRISWGAGSMLGPPRPTTLGATRCPHRAGQLKVVASGTLTLQAHSAVHSWSGLESDSATMTCLAQRDHWSREAAEGYRGTDCSERASSTRWLPGWGTGPGQDAHGACNTVG